MNSTEIFDFLEGLRKNNTREWFHENKKTYDRVKNDFVSSVQDIMDGISEFDDITGISPKQTLFRVNRDIRFSKDKTLYKTNFGSFIVKGGKKSGNAGYYLHLEQGASFLGGGIYLPPSDNLKSIRKEIYYNTEEFKNIIYDKKFVECFGQLGGEKLVRPPKDFPKDFPDIELLKHKGYFVAHPLSDKQLKSKNISKTILDIFKIMHPLNSFLNRALEF